MKKSMLALILCGSISGALYAQEPAELTIPVQKLDESGNSDIGEVVVSESEYGLVFSADLSDLSPGLHGFHIHENPSCEADEKDGKMVPGLAAGGHWDPENTGQHGYSWQDDAHLGDLPALYVDEDGNARGSVLAPRLSSLDEIKGRALMIHAGGDNHSDEPEPLGGGGARMACGVIE